MPPASSLKEEHVAVIKIKEWTNTYSEGNAAAYFLRQRVLEKSVGSGVSVWNSEAETIDKNVGEEAEPANT